MRKTTSTLLVAMAVLLGHAQLCQARGFGGFGGGGFHGGGFGGGGFHGGGFGGGGFHPGGFGPYHPGGGFQPAGGFNRFAGGGFNPRPGEFNGGRLPNAGNFNRGDFNRGNFNRGDLNRFNPGGRNPGQFAHTHLPSDFGFGHGGAQNFLPRGHATHAWSAGTMRNRASNVRNNYWHHGYFNRNWWRNHPGAWFAAGWAFGRCWAWTAWPVLYPWYGWGAVAPIYYDYGTNIVYDNNEVYYGNEPVASADQYYDQAQQIAETDASTSGDQGEWKPLGVFGLVQGEQAAASAVFQLATSKQGAIGGNFCDMLTGSTLKVHGSVDRQTQRAAWTVGDNKTTVYDTGIYNLTKDEAPLLVHFGKDRTEQWMLVRLKQPDQDDAAAPDKDAAGATPPTNTD